MGSSTCCTSRQPPSPDAVSPRPVRSPSLTPVNTLRNSPRKTSNFRNGELQTQVTAWSSATKMENTTEIKAVSEGECSPDSDKENEIVVVDEGDSDDDDEDERRQEVKPMLSSNTLKSVKSRLIKTFSREPGIAKADKRKSIGTSQEEVERRKELRRIRQKRIEEELSYDNGYDEDAQSTSTVNCPAMRTDKGQKRQSVLPEDSGNFPIFRKQSSSFGSEAVSNGSKISLSTSNNDNTCRISLSATKLDDTSKVSLLKPADRGKSRTYLGPGDPNSNLLKPVNTPPRRYSSPGPCPTPSETDLFQPGQYHLRKTDSEVSAIPSASLAEAQNLPSSAALDPSTASSWRLSYTSQQSNRGAHLRRLSQQFEAPIQSATDVANVGTQTLPRWLKTHGFRSSSQAITTSEGSTLPKEPSFMRPPRSDTGFGGVDGSGSFSNMHLQDMDISKRLLQSSCSSPQLVSREDHHREASGISTATQSRARYMRNPSETISIPSCPSIALSELVPPNWGKLPNDGTSSFYPTVPNSIQPSPECSRFELSPFMSANRSIPTMVEPQVIDGIMTPLRSPQMPAALGSDTPTTINVSLTSLHAPLSRYSAKQIDESSLFASETTSFRERELELSHIQARFASSDLRRPPSTPISSKFREEFDISLTPQPKSPFQKLVRACSLNRSRDVVEEDPLLAPPPHRSGFGYRFISTPTTLSRRSTARHSTPTKRTAERRRTPIVDDSIDTPVKGKFFAFRRFKRLASLGGYDGPADDHRGSRSESGTVRRPSALDARLGLGAEMTANEAQRKISIPPSIPSIRLPTPESPNINTADTHEHGVLARMATTMHVPTPELHLAGHLGRMATTMHIPNPEIHMPDTLARIGTAMHIDLPTPHFPDASSILHTPHIDIPTPHLPSIPHISFGHHDSDSPPKEKKGPNAAPAIAPIAAPKSKVQRPSNDPQGGAPQWRGPRARNRSTTREDNRRRMDTSQDDSAAVWMRAVKGAVSDRSKARKDNQDGDDIFGDWEAQLAGVASKSKYESRKFGSRGKPKIHQIEQFPEAWCRFPSHERNARGHESAGVESAVEAKDFAILKPGNEALGRSEHSYGTRRRRRPGMYTENSSDPSNSQGLSDEELDAIEAAEPFYKRWSHKIKIAWMDYRIEDAQKKHAFHSGSLGRRGSMTMDGKVPFPELELLPMRAPPPPSEVVDDEADDIEAERKRVEAIQKAKIKPHYEAADLTQSKGGVSDLLDIFSSGPEEPAEPKMPVKKKGPKAKKVKDPYALDEDDDLGGDGGEKGDEDEMPKKKGRKVKDPYAIDDDDDDEDPPPAPKKKEKAKDPYAIDDDENEEMPPIPKKKGKAKDPYAIDDDKDGSSDFGSGDELGKIDQIMMKEVLSDDDTIDHTRFEDSVISFRDPEFYQDCLVMPKEPSPVHVKECSVLSSHGIIEEEIEDPSKNGVGIGVQVKEIGEGVIKQIEKFKTWNGKDWEKEMGGFLKRRDTSVGRDSMRSARSAWSMGSQGSRNTVRSVGVEVKRLEDLERERKALRKDGGHLTGGVPRRARGNRGWDNERGHERSASLGGRVVGFEGLSGSSETRGRRLTFGSGR
ncbi:hypothetical protein BGAL_0289g00160 [Botrytis galanthina]|uniref:Uncharacterized protein n=1 Tax=Botrytis galanthina TaxID=278940 RepID=A0A4S8QRW2_9HELO|nr:hypothetical protein BGAL_0289g00160 [Botrytis galanthina]